MIFIYQLVPLLVAALHVSAHGVITNVSGANGVAGQAFGVVATTPRTGSKRDPFQQDSSIIRDREISSGKAGVCGRTLGGGNNDVQAMLAGEPPSFPLSQSRTNALAFFSCIERRSTICCG